MRQRGKGLAEKEKRWRRRLWRAWRQWSRRLAFWLGALAVGGVSIVFAQMANWAQAVFGAASHAYWALPALLTPAGFVFCAWAAREFFPGSQGSGIPQAIAARQMPRGQALQWLLSLRIGFGKIGLTVIGLLCGASVGREGPTVQVGAALMLQVARIESLANEGGLILAGSAAGIAAAFNAPLAGIVFAIEEMSRSFEVRTNGLVLTTVIISGLVSLGLAGNYTYFGITHAAVTQPRDWLLTIGCGALGGLAGGAFSRLMLEGGRLASGWIAAHEARRRYLFPLGCGIAVALLGLATHGATFGTGYGVARAAVEGHAPPWYFWLAKLAATLITAISGLPGGIFAPSLAVGAGLGAWLGGASGASLGAVLGMAGYFAGVVQAPMTAFVIILEMTGNDANVIPLMLAAMIGLGASRLVSREPLYHALSRNFLRASADSADRPPADSAEQPTHRTTK